MNDKTWPQTQAGSTLLYVLFILFVITLLATTVTTIMLRSNRVTLGLSQATHAHYAAESGTERALYYLQYARVVKNIGVESAVDSISHFVGIFDTQANYSVAATVTDDNYAPNIAKNASQQWDIFGESYPSGFEYSPTLTPLPGQVNMSVSWNQGSTCTSSSATEISFSSWTQYEWQDISDPSTLQTRYIIQCPHMVGPNPPDCNYTFGIDDTHLYKVRVKPLDCASEAVTVVALDSSDVSIASYNLVTLESTGEYSGSTRVLHSTRTLWNPRLQRYFDFVVFSEEQITK